MLLSRTHEYALQALIHLAAHDDAPMLGRDIAGHLGVPAPYLGKILKDLVAQGFVTSTKGRGGGYRIAPRGRRARVSTVLAHVGGRDIFAGCVLGLKTCSTETACPVHAAWAPLKARLRAIFDAHTVGSMAAQVRDGRYRLAPARPPRAAGRPRRSRPGQS